MKVEKRNIKHYPVLIEQDEDNLYIVSCPSFKGCHSYGETIDEAMDNIREVIELCLEEEQNDYKRTNRFIGFREMQIQQNIATAQ
ncbi:MAG: type II toxin-antitoxin system HicB family antitoxin [Bacteroidetes bacterium]|nr:type II toxin-antitoxin system HicB family antitoxin [Bacteroidota bacterium]MBL7103354.1 type II toxin-antitoxin system HicB family antitoxin [Bacteroidales bacterium]